MLNQNFLFQKIKNLKEKLFYFFFKSFWKEMLSASGSIDLNSSFWQDVPDSILQDVYNELGYVVILSIFFISKKKIKKKKNNTNL